MEQELRVWLRLCIFFGIYVQPLKIKHAKAEGGFFQLARAQRTWNGSYNKCDYFLWLQRLHICLLTLIVCALYLHGFCWHGALPNLLLTWVMSVTLFSFQVLTNLLILMEAVCRRSEHDHFLLLLEEIEVSLKLRLRLNVRRHELTRSLRYLVSYLIALSLLGLILFSITSLWLNYIGFFWNGLWSILTMRVRIIQLLVYVRTLQHYLDCLHAKLQQIVAYRLAPQRQLLDVDYDRLGSLNCLLAIKEIYSHIYNAFQLLNYFGGWSFFSVLLCYMLDISCNIYWTLISLDGFISWKNYYIAGPLAIVPRIAVVFHLCYLCDKCRELALNINELMNRIYVSSTVKSLASYRLTVHQFSTQLQLQRIEVTAQNFFALEMRLLLTILTVIASNLVILLQFLALWLETVYNTTTNVSAVCGTCQYLG